MLDLKVLAQCAQDAADHATRLKSILGKRAFASEMKHRASELESNAYRMELEAKASILCQWQGRRLPKPRRWFTEPVISNLPYLDARALALRLRSWPAQVRGDGLIHRFRLAPARTSAWLAAPTALTISKIRLRTRASRIL